MKDYKDWMAHKAQINNANKRPGYRVGDIWWASIGENIGFEEDGKGEKFARPVLILTAFSFGLLLCVPLSTTNKRGKYYHEFVAKDGEMSVALLSQIRAIDTIRLRNIKSSVCGQELQIISRKIKKLF
jgi:mRNA interferase MazF